MGRGKAKMELIEKTKSRISTFKARKQTLVEMLKELTILCDVPACMIVFDPATNASSFWAPENDPGEVRRLIAAYRAGNRNEEEAESRRLYALSDYFNDRQRRIEGELLKLRKKNLEAKFPTWDDSLLFMGESQLRDFAAALRGKAAEVRSRIDVLKNRMMMMMVSSHYYYYPNLGLDVDTLPRDCAAAELPVSVLPNYEYAPPPPQQPYMLVDENGNCWDCGDGIHLFNSSFF